jgi:glycosyltransferase involved in cell wall biosynthesis
MNFPEYQKINDQYKVAILIDDIQSETLAQTINEVMKNDVLLKELRQNCLEARQKLNWQNEEKTLIRFYNQIFESE